MTLVLLVLFDFLYRLLIRIHEYFNIRMIDYGSHIFMHINGYIFIINNFYARNSVNQSSEDHATDMVRYI